MLFRSHVSAECYPVAKAGGLGDVVGALPKYQRELGHIAKVVMPIYLVKLELTVIEDRGVKYNSLREVLEKKPIEG